MRPASLARSASLAFATLACAFGAGSCTSPMYDQPPVIALDTWDLLAGDSTDGLIQELRRHSGGPDVWLAFVGLKNESAKPLDTTRNAIEMRISEALQHATDATGRELVRVIDNQAVAEIAMRELKMTPSELLVGNKYEQWVALLKKNGRRPDYLVFGTFTSIDTESEWEYAVSLKMVRVEGDNGYEVVAQDSGRARVKTGR